jgi:hypothetical protein
VHYQPPVVSRVVMGTQFYPAYAVAPQVVYINGYPHVPVHQAHPRHDRKDRHDRREHRRDRHENRWERDWR